MCKINNNSINVHISYNSFKIIGFFIVILLSILFLINGTSILLYLSDIIKNTYISTRLNDLALFIEGKGINDSTVIGRLYFYKASIKTFLNNPFFGVGEHWSENYITGVGQHSEILDAFARYGIFGGGLWIFVLFLVFYKNC